MPSKEESDVLWGDRRASTTYVTTGRLHAGDMIDDGEWETEIHIEVRTIKSPNEHERDLRWSFVCRGVFPEFEVRSDCHFKTEDAARRAAVLMARAMLEIMSEIEK